jgi:hypothetical protein
MRSARLRLLLAPTAAALVLVGCGPRGPSIPALPRAASGDPAVSAHTDEAAVLSKGKKPGPRQKRLPQLSPMDWTKE